jgi:hypothetical protein
MAELDQMNPPSKKKQIRISLYREIENKKLEWAVTKNFNFLKFHSLRFQLSDVSLKS